MARQSPGTDGEEDRQHHRELFWQQRDGNRKSCQASRNPVAAHDAVGDRDQQAEYDRDNAQNDHKATGCFLKRCPLHFTRQGRPYGAYVRVRASSRDLYQTLTCNQHRAGEELVVIRIILLIGLIQIVQHRLLGHGDRLARKGGLVHCKDIALSKHSICRDAFAFHDKSDVAGD